MWLDDQKQLPGFFFYSSPKDMFIDFREKGRKGEGGRERERETLIGCLLYVPQPGIKPAT